MIILIAALIGAALGAYQARRRKGRTADILQYAAVYALIFALAGLFATILLDRTMR
ncbi:hypothetical protein [Roseovarius pelagicus]|uniref:PEP-CTERM protein-sorting domain-containing protein n=1 Tax=Roseovarius pelagicus TaxID=2980108 RepID=A0ABY6DBC4_9RHOB|nr:MULTISPECIES: hypothetical protein [Rhodobacterales]UXX83436.1 hypothetical protein N7U68_01765 [Roseovarius pelagicus]